MIYSFFSFKYIVKEHFHLLFYLVAGGRCVTTLQSGHSQLTVAADALSNFGFTRINPATIYFKGIKLEFGVLHLKTASRLIHSQFTCAPGPNSQNEKWPGQN